MDRIAIRTQNLGKRYTIDRMKRHGGQTLREDVMMRLSRWGRKGKIVQDRFWALSDLNLEVKAGEAIGVVGANGSGKSTLLKLLARVAWPTTGQIELFGRVGALLEVGTGFHPDLTGRENIFLCGAILGMKRAEITQRFDEIVAFSEVESFLDVPVKRYSSGMFLRLAFAVMSHLNSEILIVDEIIAVGDQQFQEKCLQKMKQIVREGRTIFFVSHQAEKVRALCQRLLWLKEGKLVMDGNTEEVLAKYEGLLQV